MRLSFKIFISCFLFAVLVGAFSAFCFADESGETVYNRAMSITTKQAINCFLPVYPSDVKDVGIDGFSSYPLIYSLSVGDHTLNFAVSDSNLYISRGDYVSSYPISQSLSYINGIQALSNYYGNTRLAFSFNNSVNYFSSLSDSSFVETSYSFVFVYSTFSNPFVSSSSYEFPFSFDPSLFSLAGIRSYLTTFYDNHLYLHSLISLQDFVNSYMSQYFTFSKTFQLFPYFVSSIVSSWGSVIIQIVDKANWILILPVFAYIFVVASSSLRSFYKG